MNMLQKWKRFWTLNPKSNAGFTLVELIVVIAIVAILGGVAVPVYSGYIKRAERAADEQLLAAINKGFAAACVTAGAEVYLIDEADVDMTDDKKVTGITKAVASVGTVALADVDNAFKMFYVNENPDAAFKVIQSLVFDSALHMFIDPEAASSITLGYAGAKITVTAAQIQALKDSSYYGEEMTSAALLQQVDGAAAVAGALNTIGGLQSSPEFIAFAADALGLDSAGDLPAALFNMANEALNGDYESFDDVPDALAEAYANKMQQIKNNAMVLYTAQQTTKLDPEDASQLLDGVGTVDKFSETIKANMKSDDATKKQEGLSQAALAYGMYYAYVNSDACKDANVEKVNIEPLTVIDALDTDPDFQEFMKSPQGQKDMKAYLEALSIVDDGAKNPDAVEKLVTNGFVDLEGLLTDTMGK